MKPFVVTIDGPAGSGKSSTAREVARRLRFAHLDSGALYRAFTHAALERGVARPDGAVESERLPELLAEPIEARVRDRGLEIAYRGKRLDAELRSDRVTAAVSAVSALPEVRARVNEAVRDAAARHGGGVVCEGRDIGAHVFPDAELKIFLSADPRERARRRLRERGESLEPEAVEAEVQRLLERDRRDAERRASPFRRPADAVDVDTTALTPDEQADRIVRLARSRGAPEPA